MQKSAMFGIGAAAVAVAAVAIVAPGEAQTHRITAKYNAPLKVAPNPQARILATVPKGSPLTLDYCNGQEWCRVSFRNKVGWMAAVNLNLPAYTHTGKVRSDAALRAGPGIQYTKVATLKRGTHVNVSECKTQLVQWCHVNDGPRRGWVARSLLDLTEWNRPPDPDPVPLPGPVPGPGTGSELVLYTGANCQGNTMRTLEAVGTVNYPVRSFRVEGGSGNPTQDAWHVCNGTNYGGICVVAAPACGNVNMVGGVRSVRPLSGWSGGAGPGACTKEFVPVCARSGRVERTFGNACEARAAGFTIRYQGQCR